MKLRKDDKIKLLDAVSAVLLSIEVKEEFVIFKYHCKAMLEEKDFLALKDLKTQLSNDIFCK